MNKTATLTLCMLATSASADITIRNAAALEWQETPEGVAFAALTGDRFNNSYMSMVRLPAGLTSPAHVKTADMYGVMIEGAMTHQSVGADPADAPRVGPGGWYHIPGGEPHVSSCVSEVPCVTFLYQPGAFDFLPVAP